MTTFESKVVKEIEIEYFANNSYVLHEEKNVFRGGCAIYKQHVFRRYMHPVERFCRVSACVLSFAATCPIATIVAVGENANRGCFSRLCQVNFSDPCDGYASKVRYVLDEEATEKAVEDEFRELGFDPKNAEARKRFMQTKKCFRYLSHEYCLVEGPVSKSFFSIFAPYGDRSNTILSYCFDNITGEKLSSVAAHANIRNNCEYSSNSTIPFVPNIHTQDERLTEETALLIEEQP